MSTWEIREGDVLDRLREMPDESVHCVVTSPPYFGLRDYGTAAWADGDPECGHVQETRHQEQGATSQRNSRVNVEDQRNENFRNVCGRCGARRVDQQLGLEATPDCGLWALSPALREATGLASCGKCYVCRMTAVFREVRRVLRSDGTCWANMGDSYAGGGRGGNPDESAFRKQATNVGSLIAPSPVPVGLKPKDLVGMPWRLAFALQADGWWLRSEIIWAKPNPMPESVRDRPTKAHEQIFLLTKAARYYYDADAIREPHQDNAPFSRFGNTGAQGGYSGESLKGTDGLARESFAIAKGGRQYNPAGRNARSVWTIATAPFSEAHFATYPPELVRRCVLAGTSERGVCPACGAPWVRVVERDYAVTSGSTGGRRREADMHDARDSRLPRMELSVTTTGWDPTCAHGGEYEGKNAGNDAQDNQRRLLKSIKAARAAGGSKHDNPFPPKSTTGWDPECSHALDPVPAVVLDPFAGSGTTLMVAVRHGRSALGIELNESYAEMARRRILADHGAVEPTNGHTPPTGVQARMVGV